MAWIELHQSLVTHKKTRRLARALGLGVPDGIPQAIGHLCIFWLWCVDNTEDGSLAELDAQDIADAAGWTGDPEKFTEAMVAAEFIDKTEGGLNRHDWNDYIGKLIERRESEKLKERNQKRQYRERKRKEAEETHLKPEDLPTMDDDILVDDESMKVATTYEYNIGNLPIGDARERLMQDVDDLSADVMVEAIKLTNLAHPKFPRNYLDSLVHKLRELHIDTVEKFNTYIKDRELEKTQGKWQNAPASEPPAIQGDFY